MPSGRSRWQVFAADRNAGPLQEMPLIVTEEEPPFACLIEKPSPPGPVVGSGKFGTLCARMHCATAKSLLADPVAVARDVLQDPLAATASTQPSTGSWATCIASAEP
jgi:hypothetical protein